MDQADSNGGKGIVDILEQNLASGLSKGIVDINHFAGS